MRLTFDDFILITQKYLLKYLQFADPIHIIIAFLITFVFLRFRILGRQQKTAFLRSFIYSIYFTLVITITLLGREIHGVSNSIYTLLSTYNALLCEKKYWVVFEIIYNVALFVPLGCIIHYHFKKVVFIYIAVVVSFAIEIIQLLLGIGLLEISDLINNTLGAILGYALVYLHKTISHNRSLANIFVD